jgi:6,7-dimethyl-8-ribityllumazine synthase
MTHPPTRDTTCSRIGVVASRWHADIVDRAVQTFVEELGRRGISDVDLFEVPGAFEIPLRVQRLARTGAYAAIAACGFVVNGGIYRHDFVGATVIDGLMRVQLDTDVPVFSAVLTPLHFHEHDEHHGFFREHFVTKGRELASAVAETVGTTVTPGG